MLSDVRTGMPGSADEREGGDAAAAFVFGDSDDAIAEVIAEATVTDEFLIGGAFPARPLRKSGRSGSVSHAYLPLAEEAFTPP